MRPVLTVAGHCCVNGVPEESARPQPAQEDCVTSKQARARVGARRRFEGGTRAARIAAALAHDVAAIARSRQLRIQTPSASAERCRNGLSSAAGCDGSIRGGSAVRSVKAQRQRDAVSLTFRSRTRERSNGSSTLPRYSSALQQGADQRLPGAPGLRPLAGADAALERGAACSTNTSPEQNSTEHELRPFSRMRRQRSARSRSESTTSPSVGWRVI